jgi:hypothetical protein
MAWKERDLDPETAYNAWTLSSLFFPEGYNYRDYEVYYVVGKPLEGDNEKVVIEIVLEKRDSVFNREASLSPPAENTEGKRQR